MRVAQEEIFGPVVSFLKASSLEQAIEINNRTRYGLSSSIFIARRRIAPSRRCAISTPASCT